MENSGNLKNDKLFISSISPKIEEKFHSYFGNKVVSKKFSIPKGDSFYPNIPKRELLNTSEKRKK